jgi:hypothetical protein
MVPLLGNFTLRGASMPIVDGRNILPDEAMHRGLCPECGAPLTPRTALAHANGHWGNRLLSVEGKRRYDMLRDFAAGTRADGMVEQPPEQLSITNPDAPPDDRPVKTFLDYVALALILEAGSAFWRGESIGRVVAGLIGGGLVLVAHYKWDWLRTQLGHRFEETAISVATDFKWWLAPILLLFLYVGWPTFTASVRHVSSSAEQAPRYNGDDSAKSQVADLQQQLDRANAEIRSLRTQQQVSPATSTGSGAPISWNNSFSVSQTTDAKGELLLLAIIFSGTNTGPTPMQLNDAYIVSELTGAREPLQVSMAPGQLAAITEINQIPPNAPIELWAPLKPGLRAAEFLAQWGRLRFHAEYGGIKYDKVFDENTVTDYLRRFPFAHIGPHITRKSGG